MHRRWLASLSLLGLLMTAAQPTGAQVHVGPQVSVGSDGGLGLGARIVFPLQRANSFFDGTFDGNFFFGGGSAVDSWIDTNFNLRVRVPVARDFTTRIGAGLNTTFISTEQSSPGTSTSTKFGLNLVASAGLPAGRMAPFIELRTVLGGNEQVVLAGGFTLGTRR
jgi:hypothetical protein